MILVKENSIDAFLDDNLQPSEVADATYIRRFVFNEKGKLIQTLLLKKGSIAVSKSVVTDQLFRFITLKGGKRIKILNREALKDSFPNLKDISIKIPATNMSSDHRDYIHRMLDILNDNDKKWLSNVNKISFYPGTPKTYEDADVLMMWYPQSKSIKVYKGMFDSLDSFASQKKKDAHMKHIWDHEVAHSIFDYISDNPRFKDLLQTFSHKSLNGKPFTSYSSEFKTKAQELKRYEGLQSSKARSAAYLYLTENFAEAVRLHKNPKTARYFEDYTDIDYSSEEGRAFKNLISVYSKEG